MDCPYTPVEITNIVNRMPNSYGIISGLNMFAFKGIAGTKFGIEEINGDACSALVPTAPYCCDYDPNANDVPGRTFRYIDVPHTPLNDAVRACDISGMSASGNLGLDQSFQTIDDEVIERNALMRGKMEMTLEYRYLSALKGVIYDADGATKILDLFQHFGITQTVVDFEFTNPDFDVLAACRQVIRAIRDAGHQIGFNQVRAYVDAGFFDALVQHPSAIDIWKRCCEMSARAMDDMNQTVTPRFFFGQILFVEYHEQACHPRAINNVDGVKAAVQFLSPATGIAFPLGITGQRLYELVGAPKQALDTVNRTADRLYYADIRPNRRGTAVELELEMNALPIVKQPGVLIKLTMS